ncbi:26S proteasome regulatory subunit RPN6 [Candida parapsilosis]|uniref:26S proteasome regulatory subunit RPN6 n=1 Tax=Candida parapsilosis TaxID=5480 RepID=A0A8X7T9S6_CANPA|nr:26S proteasome regulatory subunit RPN6 [Candida parapsilosis]KAF6047668.1 26S proteasome regulatory subunit RPN6 [Candida parapsilosis]KAF6050364.1 26S proteasome regulatory subunit RPN6 [Candida parapsilosis]KAF6061485.1 26S proteasome regulatory subunit RPN6 [Candida parapsilosis]KAI5904765.1 26S proteasome regulatory subunit RPN6 [Candida parapsilosis]
MSDKALLEEAREAVNKKQFDVAETKYKKILEDSKQEASTSAKVLQLQENAILELGKIYRTLDQPQKLLQVITDSRQLLGNFAKSKTAKIVRTLIEYFDNLTDALDVQIEATRQSIDWAMESKLSFLRQSLQLKLSDLLYQKHQYHEALKYINELLREYKKLDDKSSLVEVQLLESKIYHALRNIAKSKAALTSARTSANSIYCPTLLQAELDCQSGILNMEDKDYKTAFSYFYESFEGFNSQQSDENSKTAVKVLKYMLLSKIMLNLIDDVNNILKNKNMAQYQSKDIDAMKSIAVAYSNRSLKEFENSLIQYSTELKSDDIIKNHFNSLYDQLLQVNLLKIIESYECVELEHIAKVIGLNVKQVEGKLSQMILDKVFYGVLDQGNGWLIIYDEPKKDGAYEASLDLVKNLSGVVDLLYEKATALN